MTSFAAIVLAVILGVLPCAVASGSAVAGLRRAYPGIPPEFLERQLVR